jgi:phi13 family phage major tail protein
MSDKNKVKFGLRNVHYAPITEANGVVSYGTPVYIPGAVNLTLSAAGENVQFAAEDQAAYYEENTNNGYEGSLEMALIPDTFKVDILGSKIDANGAIIENAAAKVKRFALMFEFDGDINKTRHVCYNVLATRPDVASSTTTNTKEPVTETMNITARPAIDTGDVKAKLTQGQPGYDDFFSAVYLADAPVNTVASDEETFSKAVPADISIDVTSTDLTNSVKNVLLDGALIPGIYLTVDGVDVVIDQAYIAGLDNGNYVVTVELAKGNSVSIILTVGA